MKAIVRDPGDRLITMIESYRCRFDRGGVKALGDHWQRIGQSIARAEPINPHTRFREKCHDRQRIRRTIPGLSTITA
jgi:hypothetical protein